MNEVRVMDDEYERAWVISRDIDGRKKYTVSLDSCIDNWITSCDTRIEAEAFIYENGLVYLGFVSCLEYNN